MSGSTFIGNMEEKQSFIGAATQDNTFLPKDSLCVSCIAGLVGFTTENLQTNQQSNSIVFDKVYNKFFLYFALRVFLSAKAKTGNTFANMNKGDFSAIPLLYPSMSNLYNFHAKGEVTFSTSKIY